MPTNGTQLSWDTTGQAWDEPALTWDGTSANSNGVATLDTIPGNPPTFADYEALRAKVNELIGALRR